MLCEAGTCYNFRCRLLPGYFWNAYGDELAPEQIEAMAVWEKKLCEVSAAKREAASARRAAALVCVQEFFATFANEIVQLQKKNLRDAVMSNQAHSYAEWMQAQNFFVRDFHLLTVEESDLLEDWELVLCDTSVAFLPRLERSFARVTAFVAEHSEQLRAQTRKLCWTLSRAKTCNPFLCHVFVVYLRNDIYTVCRGNRLQKWKGGNAICVSLRQSLLTSF